MTRYASCDRHIFGGNIAAMSDAFPSGAKAATFIITRDRAVAKKFYGETLGFKQVHEDNFAVVFDLNGTKLRISTLKDHQPQKFTVLGWEVSDIVAAVKTLTAKGITFNRYDGFQQDELGIWSPPGSTNKVAWFLDPDGNNLSLAQLD
jgi:catechol 2,3-dioxygenase-like lactoylglutathione lyase family enzyme